VKQSDFPQLELMRQGIEYRFPVMCRGYKVLLRPLTTLETIQATSEAAEAFQRLPATQQLSVTASLLSAMHQLEKASSKEPGVPGELSLALLQFMHSEEVNHLWKQYVRIIDKVNPSFEEMPVYELEKLVEDLKKNSDPSSILIDLSISNLIAVCRKLLIPPPI
jgi:hypothetical protein